MYREIDKKLCQHFGLNQMGKFFSKQCASYVEEITDGFLNQKMVVIAGPVGTMKTNIFETASDNQQDICRFVYVANPFKERVNVATIINAILYEMGVESPKRDLEARTIQLRRILGEQIIKQNLNLVVVIEEAHRLHPNIFRAIKELREMTYAGRKNLMSIVLIGHEQLVSNLMLRKEAYWRSEVIEFNEYNGWMTFTERLSYVKQVFGAAITPDAAKTIATLNKVPLQIVDFVEKKMREARKAGKKIIDSEVVKPTARELYEAHRDSISFRDIAKELNISSTTVNDALKNPKSKYSDQISEAINNVIARRGDLSSSIVERKKSA